MTTDDLVWIRSAGARPVAQDLWPPSSTARTSNVLLFRAALAALVGVFLPHALDGQATGSISGRVIDEDSLRPVPGVLVSVEGVEPVLTDGNGLFVLEVVPIGDRLLVLDHLAYGEHRRGVLVERDADLMIEARMSSQAIELAPLIVEALSELDYRRVTSGHGMTEVTRPEIDAAARAGFDLSRLLGVMPGVQVTPGGFAQRVCVQYRGGSGSSCRQVAIILDGVQVSDPGLLYATMPLDNIERMEILSPGEAGVRYGRAAAQGILLIETKQGPRPGRVDDVNRYVTGFDWSGEEEPYPWIRVYGSSFIANAVGVGVGMLVANRCLWSPDNPSPGLRTRCGGLATVGSGLLSLGLPAIGGSLAARWGGGTERSRGRFGPTALAAGIALTSGYLLVIEGGSTNEVVGVVVLALAAPLLMTLSDRVFRVLR